MLMTAPILILLLAGLVNVQAAETPHAGPQNLDRSAPLTVTKHIGVEEFERLRAQKTNVVLDVRTRREFASGHIPGAINIDIKDKDFEKKVAALGPNKTCLVHCAVGGRSAQACERLNRLHFGTLYNLQGGFKEWTKAGNKPER